MITVSITSINKSVSAWILSVAATFIVSKAYCFDTPQGRYLSQQELLLNISSIFTKLNPNVNLLESYNFYNYTYDRIVDKQKNNYEIGFVNLDTGDPIAHGPNPGYLIYIDQLISQGILAISTNYYCDVAEQIFEKDGSKNLINPVMGNFNCASATVYNLLINNRFNNFKTDYQKALLRKFSLIVWEDESLMPEKAFENEKKIFKKATESDMTLYQALELSLKTNIISEDFLRYEK